jgi:branched-subunit amino acid transport protein
MGSNINENSRNLLQYSLNSIIEATQFSGILTNTHRSWLSVNKFQYIH